MFVILGDVLLDEHEYTKVTYTKICFPMVAKGWTILAKNILEVVVRLILLPVRAGELCFIEVKGRDDIDRGYDLFLLQ